MKLTILMLFLSIFSVQAAVVAQSLTLNGKDLTYQQVFTEIEKQTGYLVFGNKELVKSEKRISVNVTDLPLREFLDIILKGQPYKYAIEGKTVFLSKKKDSLRTNVSGDEYYDKMVSPPPISGRILSADGQPLEGASVRIKGSKKGTASDKNGQFSLDAKPGQTIIVSYTGYLEKEVIVEMATDIIIVLQPGSLDLEEVTVSTGYWTTEKRKSVGNISKVTAKDIENQPITNPLMSLQGRVPGLEITPQNGVPGTAPTIRIRGNNSLRPAGSYPLYVIDGVIVDSRPITSSSLGLAESGFDPLSTINPSSIQSIEVLKDADATAIYGSRGANGVIVITTKQGSGAEKINLDLNFYAGFGNVTKKLPLLNTAEYLEMRHEALKNAGLTPSVFDFDINGNSQWDTTRYTDWQEELLGKTAQIRDAQIGISGGNKTTTFRFTGGYHDESTIYSRDNGFGNASGMFNLKHHSSNGKFDGDFTINYGHAKNKLFSNGSFIAYAMGSIPPNGPALYDELGELNWAIIDFGFFKFNSWNNPLSVLLRTHESITKNLVINSTLRYGLFEGAYAKINFGFTNLNSDENIRYPIASNPPISVFGTSTAYAAFGTNKRDSWIVEPQFEYSRKIGNHNIYSIIGTTLQKSTSTYQSIDAQGYESDALLHTLAGAKTTTIKEDRFAQYNYAAVFMRIGYDYKDKYLLNLTGRRDGSSRFGPGNQFAAFGAIGAGWIFTNEPTLSNSKLLSFGKLRGSIGTTGNDQIGDYQFYEIYKIATLRYDDRVSLLPSALFNPSFRWGITNKMEVALELGLFQDRIQLSTSWYQHRSSNQLINYALPATTGFEGVLKNFDATVQNTGWEFSLNSNLIRSGNVLWTISGNLTIPKNKLLSFQDIESSSYRTRYKVGEPLSLLELYTWTGVDPATGKHTVADISGDGEITQADMQLMAATDRKFFGGVNNSVRYKSLELSFLLQFSNQQKVGNNTYSLPGSLGNYPKDVVNRWQKPGDQTRIAKYSLDSDDISFYGNVVKASTYILDNANFIRLKTLGISYLVPQHILKPTGISSLRIFLQGQNLLTLTKFSGLDPETGVAMPPLRIITVGLQIQL